MTNPFAGGMEAKETVLKEVKSESSIDQEVMDKLDAKISIEKRSRLPRTGGAWEGEEGNSKWIPDSEVVPGDRNGTNPEQKSWKEIKKEYGFESIEYKDSQTEFNEVSKGRVEIDDFTDERDVNFSQADEKMAEHRGCTPEEVEQWRAEHKYTWHECKDCKTMQKVPSEVHGNIPHSGGISEYKSQQKSEGRE